MMKCDPKAFSRCPHKKECELNPYFSEGSECDKFNESIITAKPTNADRIRAMSDDELAVFIRKAVNLDGPNYCVNLLECDKLLETTDGIPDEKCRACLVNWLRSEAKEEAE